MRLSIRRPTLDKYQKALNEWKKISIHKALTGLDRRANCWATRTDSFQSTRPSRASTYNLHNPLRYPDISIHKALTGLDCIFVVRRFPGCISIHKALTGLDGMEYRNFVLAAVISIHKALTGLDLRKYTL